jgi:hypothetical protein
VPTFSIAMPETKYATGTAVAQFVASFVERLSDVIR